MPYRILVAVFCFTLVSSSELTESALKRRKDASFLFTYPRTFLAGKNESVCLVTQDVLGPTKILVDLKIKDKHFTTTHSLDGEHTCFKLYVPEQKFKEPHIASIHLQVELDRRIQSAHNDDPIFVYPNKNTVFIESDRPTYKPGDLVRIRLLVLNHEMKPPEKHTISTIKIVNPSGYVVDIWESIETQKGFTQVEYQLSEETTLGKWKIESEGVSKVFFVKKYTLPRFKVRINYPKVIYSGSDNFTVTICASYSYGRNVKGKALIKITSPGLLQEPITKLQVMTNGCAEWILKRNEIFFKPGHLLSLIGTVTETGSSQVETANGRIEIVNQPFKLDFSKTNKNFKPGLPYHGKLRVTNKVAPYLGEVVEICYNIAIRKPWNIKKNKQCSNFTLGEDSLIHFYVLPLKEQTVQLILSAKSIYKGNHSSEIVSSSFTVQRQYSPSLNYVHLHQNSEFISKCKSPQVFTVYFTAKGFLENENVTFYYMIRSRNEIIKLRKINHTVKLQTLDYYTEFSNVIGKPDKYTKHGMIDKFALKFRLDPKILSASQILVYYVSKKNNEVIADTTDILVEKCLLNSVQTQWLDNHLYPGELATLRINSEKGSLCGLSVVDKANSFLLEGRQLNVNSLLQPFVQERATKASYIPHCITSGKRPENLENLFDLRKRRKRSSIEPEFLTVFGDYDALDVFNEAGVSTITNMKIVNKPCRRGGRDMMGGRHQLHSVSSDNLIPNMIKTVEYEPPDESRGISIRTFFPETWLWDLIPIGVYPVSGLAFSLGVDATPSRRDNGDAIVQEHLPHSITNWVTNVLCISPDSGPGIAPTIELSVGQPFFVDIISPYSIKRGEILYLRIITFNYFNYSLPISLILGDTYGIELLDSTDKRKTNFCIEANDSKTHTYRVRGTKLGKTNVTVLAEIDSSFPGECGPETIINKLDVVYKNIVIEPEGYPSEIARTTLLCGNDSSTPNNVTWHFDVPKDIVSDSSHGKVQINADLLGPAMQNLEKLLTVPTGCGEQIMATLAPNLYVLRYLSSSTNVSTGTTQRAIRNIKIGYQRILDYVHTDGSFSAFGYHDHAGSMFLTAFVIRTLQQAKRHIFVDETVINKAVKWIMEYQLENGCFSAVSHVFQDMGGTSQENSTAALTAYVIISLLESDITVPESLKTNAKYCIRGNHQPDKYTLALTTYALYLLKWESEANRYLTKLKEVATQERNMMWWGGHSSSSLNIEMTSYALMSFLHKNTTENLAYASSIVRWLATQQNSRGGFSSTQDSAVALDALSRYAMLVKDKHPSLRVEVHTGDEEHSLEVHEVNPLKTQEIIVGSNMDNVKIKVKGQGCVLVQTSFAFNVNQLVNSEAFKLGVDVEPVSTIDKCSIATVSPCVSYTGPGLHSNMAVLEVMMPSGYQPDRASLYQLIESENSKVKKFEELQNKVALYFTELNNEPICVPFEINENVNIENHVEATVTLYDYYKPEMRVTKTYKLDTCSPNKVAPIPGIPTHNNETKHNKIFGNDSIVPTSRELALLQYPTSDEASEDEVPKTIVKRSAHASESPPTKKLKLGLNEHFVDMDVEMEMPDGMEGPMPKFAMTEKPMQ